MFSVRLKNTVNIAAVILIFLLGAPFAFSKGIDPAHRLCRADSDCSVLTIGCACIHNPTCARAEDKEKGIVDGVNKNFSKQYQDLSKCSEEETRRCSMAGACLMAGRWLPKCREQQCTVIFKAKN